MTFGSDITQRWTIQLKSRKLLVYPFEMYSDAPNEQIELQS